jgi:hypothetical protein
MKPPRNVQIFFCLFMILDWCDLFAVVVCVILVCLHAYILLLLPVIDSNENKCTKEGEVFEYQEEDQGQAIKASHLILLHI